MRKMILRQLILSLVGTLFLTGLAPLWAFDRPIYNPHSGDYIRVHNPQLDSLTVDDVTWSESVIYNALSTNSPERLIILGTVLGLKEENPQLDARQMQMAANHLEDRYRALRQASEGNTENLDLDIYQSALSSLGSVLPPGISFSVSLLDGFIAEMNKASGKWNRPQQQARAQEGLAQEVSNGTVMLATDHIFNAKLLSQEDPELAQFLNQYGARYLNGVQVTDAQGEILLKQPHLAQQSLMIQNHLDLHNLIEGHQQDVETQVKKVLETLEKQALEQRQRLEQERQRQENAANEAFRQKAEFQAQQASVDIISFVIGRFDPKLGKQFQTVGKGYLDISQAMNSYREMIARGVVTSTATLALSGNLLSVGMALGMAFASGPSPEQMILEGIQKLSEQIESLRAEMHERFDEVDHKLNLSIGLMVHSLNHLSTQNTDHYIQLRDQMASLATQLYQSYGSLYVQGLRSQEAIISEVRQNRAAIIYREFERDYRSCGKGDQVENFNKLIECMGRLADSARQVAVYMQGSTLPELESVDGHFVVGEYRGALTSQYTGVNQIEEPIPSEHWWLVGFHQIRNLFHSAPYLNRLSSPQKNAVGALNSLLSEGLRVGDSALKLRAEMNQARAMGTSSRFEHHLHNYLSVLPQFTDQLEKLSFESLHNSFVGIDLKEGRIFSTNPERINLSLPERIASCDGSEVLRGGIAQAPQLLPEKVQGLMALDQSRPQFGRRMAPLKVNFCIGKVNYGDKIQREEERKAARTHGTYTYTAVVDVHSFHPDTLSMMPTPTTKTFTAATPYDCRWVRRNLGIEIVAQIFNPLSGNFEDYGRAFHITPQTFRAFDECTAQRNGTGPKQQNWDQVDAPKILSNNWGRGAQLQNQVSRTQRPPGVLQDGSPSSDSDVFSYVQSLYQEELAFEYQRYHNQIQAWKSTPLFNDLSRALDRSRAHLEAYVTLAFPQAFESHGPLRALFYSKDQRLLKASEITANFVARTSESAELNRRAFSTITALAVEVEELRKSAQPIFPLSMERNLEQLGLMKQAHELAISQSTIEEVIAEILSYSL